ncbi:serine hydrolase [Actinoplanes teichomyceticus]|uniref:serine hydrolase n=1 Tax=Actinoplanes teichomyceticus TaxID=1867 RepID=UPI001EF33934|nr:serine hydrolase [Actinoplanes teichomyceticus]
MVLLGGAGLVGKGLIGSEGVAATFFAGDAASPSPTRPSPEELARIEWAKRGKALDAALTRYAATVPEFSVAVHDAKTGATYAFRGDEHYETASVVKVQVLACLLLTVQDAGRRLTASEDSRANLMIRNSDNDATTSLFHQLGRQSAISRCNERLGLTDTTVNSAWGLTRTTVRDQLRLLSELVDDEGPLSARGRAYVRTLMGTVAADQNWGVPAAARQGEQATVKNGWLQRSTENNLWIINSVGRITGDGVDVSVAVLSHRHQSRLGGIAVVEKVVGTTRSYLRY